MAEASWAGIKPRGDIPVCLAGTAPIASQHPSKRRPRNKRSNKTCPMCQGAMIRRANIAWASRAGAHETEWWRLIIGSANAASSGSKESALSQKVSSRYEKAQT
jgi:hypothetical protein